MSDWSQQAPMMAAAQGQTSNGYMVMMVPMMVGNGHGGVPYQQDCGQQQMMWAPQMGAMVPQGNSSMQAPVALVPAAPGMWGQQGAGSQSYGDDTANRKPGAAGVGFARQNQTFKMPDARKGGMGMGVQAPRVHPQWFTPGTSELSASAAEFTPTSFTELSATAAEFTPSSAGNIVPGKSKDDEGAAEAKRRQQEIKDKEREERRKRQAEIAAANRKRQEEEAAKKAAEEKKRAAEEVKPLDTAAFPTLGPLGGLGATSKAAPPVPKAAWGQMMKESKEKEEQKAREAKEADAAQAAEATRIANIAKVETPKIAEVVPVDKTAEAEEEPKSVEPAKPSWASKAAEAQKKRQAEEVEKAKRQEAEQERVRKQREVDDEKRRETELAARKNAAEEEAAKKAAEEKKKLAEEVKPIDASLFPTLGGSDVKAPVVKAWGKDVAKEKREKEEALRAAEAAKLQAAEAARAAEIARVARVADERKAAEDAKVAEATKAAEASKAAKAAKDAEEEARRKRQMEEATEANRRQKMTAEKHQAESFAASRRRDEEEAAKKALEEKKKAAEEVKAIDTSLFPSLSPTDKVAAAAPKAWGKEAQKKMKEDADTVKAAPRANTVESRQAQNLAATPVPAARVAGNPWGKAAEPKKEKPQATSAEAARERESGAWSDDEEQPELSTGAEATGSAEEAEEESKSETTTALDDKEVEEVDDKEDKDDDEADVKPTEDRTEEHTAVSEAQHVDEEGERQTAKVENNDEDHDVTQQREHSEEQTPETSSTITPATSSSSTALGSSFFATKKKKGKLASRSSTIMALAEDEEDAKDDAEKTANTAAQDDTRAVEKKEPVSVKHISTQVEWPTGFQEARAFFLAFRDDTGKVPAKLQSFQCENHEAGWKDSASRSSTPTSTRGTPANKDSDRGGFFGDKYRKSPANKDRQDSRDKDKDSRPVSRASSSNTLVPPTPNAYKVVGKAELSREADLKRTVQSLLNKIAPENVKVIAGKIAAEAKIVNEDELGTVIGLVMKKALAEPHYCETYADLVYHLKSDTPEFPAAEGGKPVTFKSTLLNLVQNEFEAMPTKLAPTEEAAATMHPEEIKAQMGEKKARLLANIRFIGNLYLRQLLTTKIISSIVQELMICDGGEKAVPEEHVVECICELLRSIGFTLESIPLGKAALVQVCGRMLDLKSQKGKDGKAIFSKRLQFGIQDVLDARAAGWEMKVFKKTAKTKEEVRLEQERELKAKESGKEVSSAEVVVAGQRPAYLDENVAAAQQANVEGGFQEVSKKGKR